MRTRVTYNKLLGGWFVVRGPHDTPLTGRFETRADALAWLNRDKANGGVLSALRAADRKLERDWRRSAKVED